MAKSAMPHTKAQFLSPDQINNLLSRPLIARLATINKTRPHVAAVWFVWDGVSLYMETSAGFQKAKNLLRNPQCSVIIDDTLGGLRFWGIVLEGKAELISEPEAEVLEIVQRIYRKYLGEEGMLAPTPQGMIHSGQHVIIKLTPSHIITWDDTHSAITPIG
jgi:PPOX class probable F420-dependent enzyme